MIEAVPRLVGPLVVYPPQETSVSARTSTVSNPTPNLSACKQWFAPTRWLRLSRIRLQRVKRTSEQSCLSLCPQLSNSDSNQAVAHDTQGSSFWRCLPRRVSCNNLRSLARALCNCDFEPPIDKPSIAAISLCW